MIDTHTHLYLSDSFPDGGRAAVERAIEAGVEKMVLPGIDREAVEPLLALHNLYPGHTAVALGLHPTEVEADWKNELDWILDRGSDVPLVAIGETGIDLHWDKTNLVRQMDSFGEQIQIAADNQLPVIVHSRDAVDETIEVIRGFSTGLPVMVFHSFTLGRKEAELFMEYAPDCFFGINGVITFKNAGALREAVASMDASRIVTETDSPFLAPVPHRGKTCESSYIPLIVDAIAREKGISALEMAEITTTNARRLFPNLQT